MSSSSTERDVIATPVHVLTLAGAQLVFDAAAEESRRQGVAVCVTVADRSGTPILAARMDGAPLLSQRIAEDKAWSVASFNGLPTDAWWALIQDDPSLVHGITKTPRLTIFGGGAPILVAGALAGAVGISGGSAEQDTQIARAAAAAVA